MPNIYSNPRSILQQKLNEALGTNSEQTVITDLLHLALLKKAQTNTDDLIYDEIFKLLGLETFTNLIALVDGRSFKLPTKEEFQDTIITVLCYYYKNIEHKDWSEIKEILGIKDLNSIREGIRASQFEAFVNKMANKKGVLK